MIRIVATTLAILAGLALQAGDPAAQAAAHNSQSACPVKLS